MALTLRSTKGAPLTHAEMDANFDGLADGSLISDLDSSIVDFTQSSGVAGNVQSELRRWVWVDQFGAYGDGSTDDSSIIQTVINTLADAGGGYLLFTPGKNYKCNLTLKAGVVLIGYLDGPSGNLAGSITRSRLTAFASGAVIDTEATETKGCGVIGLDIAGLGSGTACKGIRFRDVTRGVVRRVNLNNISDEGLLVDSGSIACTFEDILATNCVLDRSQSAKIGAIDVAGSDHYLHRIESTTSQSALSDSNAYLCGILIRGTTCMLDSCIGEISDIGIHLAAGASRNRFVNCRADLNFAHGFEFVNTAHYNSFTACLAFRNSQETNNTYDGFSITASAFGNFFSACRAEGLSGDSKKQRYGFADASTSATIDNRSVFVACGGQNNATGLYLVETFNGASPLFVSGPVSMADSDTTPSVLGANFLRCNAVTTDTTVTNFDDGVNGQDLLVLGDTNVTVSNNSTIKTNTGKNKLLRANTMYHFKRYNGVWLETGADQVTTGTFTCANNATTTVTDTKVSASSIIQIQPTNAAAGTLQAGATHLYINARTAGTSFTVTTADGTAAAGTETFNYIMVEPT